MSTKERFAAVTMVYQDYWYLDLWITYYAKQFGRENLYILGHGDDEEHERLCEGANLVRIPRNGIFPDFDMQRWRLLSDFSSMLVSNYEAVICSDVDEIVLAHETPNDLAGVLSSKELPERAGAIGLEVIGGDAFDDTKTVLQQAQGFVFSSRYSKPCVLKKPGRFTPGAHGMLDEWTHSRQLILFHLQYANSDLRNTRKRMLRKDIRLATRLSDQNNAAHKVHGLKSWANDKEDEYRRTKAVLDDGVVLPMDEAVERCYEVLNQTMLRSWDGLTRVRPRRARYFRASVDIPQDIAMMF